MFFKHNCILEHQPEEVEHTFTSNLEHFPCFELKQNSYVHPTIIVLATPWKTSISTLCQLHNTQLPNTQLFVYILLYWGINALFIRCTMLFSATWSEFIHIHVVNKCLDSPYLPISLQFFDLNNEIEGFQFSDWAEFISLHGHTRKFSKSDKTRAFLNSFHASVEPNHLVRGTHALTVIYIIIVHVLTSGIFL